MRTPSEATTAWKVLTWKLSGPEVPTKRPTLSHVTISAKVGVKFWTPRKEFFTRVAMAASSVAFWVVRYQILPEGVAELVFARLSTSAKKGATSGVVMALSAPAV